MFKKLICTMVLLSGSSLAPMEQTKAFSLVKESYQNEPWVKILLTDSDAIHEVALPFRLAKLLGSIADYVQENPELSDWGFPLRNVMLPEWRLIEPQLERLHSIMNEDSHATHSRETIIEEYEKLDAKILIKLIHALDYLDIPLLLEKACNVVMQNTFGRFTFEQINSLPGLTGNRVILHKILDLGGPLQAKELARCRGHKAAISSVCVTNNGTIVSGSHDGTVRVWDMTGRDRAVCWGGDYTANSVCVTNDGKMIVSGYGDGAICVCDLNGKELAVCSGHQDAVYSVCVTNDGKIVSGSLDRTARVWDMNGKELALCSGHQGAVYSVCVTNDGTIVSGSFDRTVRVWDMKGKELAVCRGHYDEVLSVCVTNDGKIVSGSHDGKVRVWDMTGRELAVCRGGNGDYSAYTVCVTNDGKIVSGYGDGVIRLWDMNGKEPVVCSGHQGAVYSISVTNDGKIVSGSRYKKVRVWDVGLFDCIMRMDERQSKALWELLHRASQQTDGDKEVLWEEVMKIVDVAQGVSATGASKNV